MKVLFILDPLKSLNVNYDSSLAMIRAFHQRGHSCFFAEPQNLSVANGKAFVESKVIKPIRNSLKFKTGSLKSQSFSHFDAVLVRKEPPFNIAFVYLTYILEVASQKTLVLNSPRGLRDANEKFSSVLFPHSMPQTLVSSSSKKILWFQSQLRKDLILKPLDERGGRGLVILKRKTPPSKKERLIQRATQRETLPILAQEFIIKPELRADKRVFLLEGNFLAAYQRRFAPGDFRGNLGQGAIHQKTRLTQREMKIISQVSPWLKRLGLHFVGLDLLDQKLLEINVTCPGGFPEADELYPELHVFEKFVRSVEKLARRKKSGQIK